MVEVECHISIMKNGTCFLGIAKINLLHTINSCGSLSSAVKELKISYQHAWNMIDELNRMAPEPLVIMYRGGTNGGGASITAYGENMLREYKLIEEQVMKTIHQINAELNF